jgi:predicted lipoprotein with Yx(FWY)xxD motif
MKPSSAGLNRRPVAIATSICVAAVALGVLLAAGPASSKPTTLVVAKNVEVGAKSEAVAATPKGRAVYQLSPETGKRLLCTSQQCLGFWPPVKVAKGAKGAKLTKGAGLKGKMGTLKRNGFTQLTLNGHPLYTFSEDTKRGEAHGEGIHGFGGVWHVFKEAGASSASPPGGSMTTTASTTQRATATNPYGY